MNKREERPNQSQSLQRIQGRKRRRVVNVEIEQRRKQALGLRRTGLSYQQIADAMGWKNKATAYNAVMRELSQGRAEASDEVRALELERLDRLQAGLWSMATSETPNLNAVDRILKIMERRAAITGLNVQRIEHSGPNGGPLEVQVVEDVHEFRRIIDAVARDAAPAGDHETAPHHPILSPHANGETVDVPPQLRP